MNSSSGVAGLETFDNLLMIASAISLMSCPLSMGLKITLFMIGRIFVLAESAQKWVWIVSGILSKKVIGVTNLFFLG